MPRALLVVLGILLGCGAANAAPITFDEPDAVAKLGQSIPSLTVNGVTFQGLDSTRWWIIPRGTFDNRAPNPYPYDFISGNVLQVAGSTFRIDFGERVSAFGFGAALNATSGLGSMTIDLFGANNTLLGTSQLLLDRTVLSQLGGTNSNSEGLFQTNPFGGNVIQYAVIHNLGDPNITSSQFNWVIDNVNVDYATVPEPAPLFLVGGGVIALLMSRRRRR